MNHTADPVPPLPGHADRLLPTLLDRLTDHAPQRRHDTPADVAVSRRQLRAIILRDLTWLLNATNAEFDPNLTQFSQVQASTLNYGLPGFSGKLAAHTKPAELQAQIQRTVQAFEPRILADSLDVRVLSSSDDEAAHNLLVFEIRGQIHAQPYPIDILLKSSMDLETGAVTLLDQMGER